VVVRRRYDGGFGCSVGSLRFSAAEWIAFEDRLHANAPATVQLAGIRRILDNITAESSREERDEALDQIGEVALLCSPQIGGTP
jgi:hypothetical protein